MNELGRRLNEGLGLMSTLCRSRHSHTHKIGFIHLKASPDHRMRGMVSLLTCSSTSFR